MLLGRGGSVLVHKCVGVGEVCLSKASNLQQPHSNQECNFQIQKIYIGLLTLFFNCINLVLTLPNCGRNDHNA